MISGLGQWAWVLSGDEIMCLCLSSVIIDGKLLTKYDIFQKNDRKRVKSLSFLFSDVFTVLVSILSVTGIGNFSKMISGN
jgi:hypothetical protein